jgi:hypothetical protein
MSDASTANAAFEDAKFEALARCRALHGNEIIDSLVQQQVTLKDVLQGVEDEIRRQKGDEGTKRARFLNSLAYLAKKVDTFSKAVDVYVNKSPDIASVVWGSFRVLLQVILSTAH